MGSKKHDLPSFVGKKIHFLTVISIAEPFKYKSGKKNAVFCKCDCGNTGVYQFSNMISGHTKSCGCHSIKMAADRTRTHGKSSHPLMGVWASMINRCKYTSNRNYFNYGGRGIKVCKEWETFINFYEWAIENGWERSLTLERKDVNGNYQPSNCEWIPFEKQAHNKRNNRFIYYKGEKKPITQWERELGIPHPSLFSWINRGGTLEGIIKKRKICYGIEHSFGYIN